MNSDAQPGGRGRPAAIAIDVGGTDIKYGIISADGELLTRGTAPTPRGGVDELIGEVARLHGQLREQLDAEAGAEGSAAAADVPTGVVVPGIVDEQRGIGVLSANLGWRDEPMRDRLTQALGVPVAFGHDVRAGALAESLWGAGRSAVGQKNNHEELSSQLFVALGTGIGGALLADGRPVVGGGYAGEIGQILVPDPMHGQLRKLEHIASASAVAERFAKRAGRIPDGAREVFALAAEHDELASEICAQAIEALSMVLAHVVATLGTQLIILGGGLAAGDRSEVIDPVHRRLQELLVVAPVPQIRRAELGKWAGCLGAGALAMKERA